MGVAALMLLMLWWRRRHETGHLALALTFSLGAILTARVYVTDLPLDKLDSTVSDAGLSDLTTLAPKILKGEVRGRVVVDVNK